MKKRNSLTLRSNRDTEEFRRMAVRRKVKSAAVLTGDALLIKRPNVCATISLSCYNIFILNFALKLFVLMPIVTTFH